MKAETRARKILKVGGSFLVTLPPEFIQKNHLKAGDFIGMIADSIVIIGVPSMPNTRAGEDGEGLRRLHTGC